MINIVAFPKLTRTRGELDLPPCGNTWGPYQCGTGIRSGPHVCWTWTGWPHICRCLRCASQDGA